MTSSQPAARVNFTVIVSLVLQMLLGFPITAVGADFDRAGILAGYVSSSAANLSADGSTAYIYQNDGTDSDLYKWAIGGSLTAMPKLAGYENSDYGIAGLNSDGSVVYGWARNFADGMAFRWTASTGIVALGTLGGAESYASGGSASGDVIVGHSTLATSHYEAFRWTESTGMVGLGFLPGDSDSYAAGTDLTGNTVVGYSWDGSVTTAFRWTNALGLQSLGNIAGYTRSYAWGCNADGTVIYGVAVEGTTQAFRWTESTGMVGLGFLPGYTVSYADYINSDGSVIVGRLYPWRDSSAGEQAFRWTESSGLVGLGFLPGYNESTATALTPDGNTIVGYSDNSGFGRTAFKWTKSAGMQSIASILAAQGVDTTGWDLTYASDISDDGRTILGGGTNPSGNFEAWIVRNAGLISVSALNDSLASMGQVGATANSMSQATTSAMMDASHGAVINTTSGLASGDEMTGRTQVWVVGTLISDSSFSGDDFGGQGGVGLTRYLANGLSVGGGVFSGRRSLDTSYGGNQKTTLLGPGVFVGYAPEAYGLRIEGGGTWYYLDMDLDRGYQNGAGSAQSDGTTQGQSFGLYGRVGWAFPVAERIALQPYVQYDWQHLKIDGYSESGGPFPASFDSRTESSNRTRLGLEAQYAYSESLDFWTWAAWDHRFESKGASMSGSLTGLFAFNYGGGPVDQDWGDAGVGAKWRPYEGFEAFSRLGIGIDSQDNAEPDLALTIGLGWDI